MAGKVKIFLFSDALGYELAQKYKFMENELVCRYPVRTQFGYSSTAVPTILSGEPPTSHGHFSFFFRSIESPFKFFKYIHFFFHPEVIFNNHRIRNRVSRLIAGWKKYTGYFNLYKVPYNRLPFFDYCEKKDIFAPGGLAPVKNIYDMLTEAGVNFRISDWRKSDADNIKQAMEWVEQGEVEFLFIYTAGLDGMLHFHVHEPETVASRFKDFAGKVRELLALAHEKYDDVGFYLFSDHGMTPLAGKVDLRKRLESKPYKFGRDYIVSYDSTMLRIWFLKPEAREDLMRCMDGEPGHWLSEDEKKAYEINFADKKYGDEIFLLDVGVQMVPSDMGSAAIPGMHGYAPEDKDSTACLMTEKEPPLIPAKIAEFFDLMKIEADDLRKGKK